MEFTQGFWKPVCEVMKLFDKCVWSALQKVLCQGIGQRPVGLQRIRKPWEMQHRSASVCNRQPGGGSEERRTPACFKGPLEHPHRFCSPEFFESLVSNVAHSNQRPHILRIFKSSEKYFFKSGSWEDTAWHRIELNGHSEGRSVSCSIWDWCLD